MSFYQLRSFTEMMRALGYTRQISMDNFRQPNFPLVAEILLWLVKRYDPSSTISSDISTEEDRTLFIKFVAEFMYTKTRVKMNLKYLYAADLFSVREMYKIVELLHSAVKAENLAGDGGEALTELSFDITNKISELKQARQLATDITTHGARLYELLAMEVDLRELRLSAISKPLEVEKMEKGLKEKLAFIDNEIKNTKNKLDNIGSDEANLASKIDKKKNELERNQKRLRTLQNVRPAFMDEFEKLEGDLKKLYNTYAEKYRNLTYLEQIAENYDRQQQLKVEETEKQLKRMQEKMKEEEKKLLNQSDDFDTGDEEVDDDFKAAAAAKLADQSTAKPRVIGGMNMDAETSDETDYLTSGDEMGGEEMRVTGDELEDDVSEGFDHKEDEDSDF